ncbi:MAG: gamma-glutamylcyclotransferase [Azoarcus sp. PHD]|jgi:gamma-glutamylcyclotransferase (GGCT)/AIG2-like uncharacterized protein YtfP|nr:MAG: gamma-glutamylcyclotransferase [Azoarcus sp. PHD]
MRKPQRRLALSIAGLGAAVAVASAYLWFQLLSPYGYLPPPGLAVIDVTRAHRVFAYGTLQYRPVRWLVMGRGAEARRAQLSSFDVAGLNIVPDATARVDGVVFEVSATELGALDRYERRGIRYARVEMDLDDGQAAWVYRRLQP